MQARLNIAKKSCIETYKAINSLISSKDEQYFINISETEHKNYFEDKMQQNIKNAYGMDNKDLVYSKNIKLLDDVYYWIINPIDDIENYKERNRYFSTSVAICKKKEILASAIINNDDGTLLTSIKGSGALLENTKLRCDDFVTSENFISNISSLEDKLLDANYEMIYGQGTITNLVDLAKGDFDFAIFEDIEMSDVAAGILLCKETGFIISGLNGREVSLTNNESIVIYRPNEQKLVRRIIDNYF